LCCLCFLSVSCVIVPGVAIVGVAVTGIVYDSNDAGPSFIFPEDTGSKKYANIGADIKIYSDNKGEWHPNDKYCYVMGKIVSGGSAELSGIEEGGILYNINGRFTERMSPHEALSYLIGGGEEILSLYIIDDEGLLKKFEVLKKNN